MMFGATSAVGSRLLPLLRERNLTVTAVSRRTLTGWQQSHPEVHWLSAALADAPSIFAGVTHVLSLGPCDAFVDWLARQPTSSSLRQVIAFGSTSAETKVDSASADERALAASLRDSEARLASECARLGVAWTLLRPTLIYGGADDLVARIGRLAARWHVYPRPLGAVGRALRQPVHAADLAAAVVACIDNPAAFNGRFDLAGQETLSLADLIRRSAHACCSFALPVPMPAEALLRLAGSIGVLPRSSALGAASRTRLARDQVFDTAPARAALGFAPRGFVP
jgi:nucleoside-diphosphate-sugar epimerase